MNLAELVDDWLRKTFEGHFYMVYTDRNKSRYGHIYWGNYLGYIFCRCDNYIYATVFEDSYRIAPQIRNPLQKASDPDFFDKLKEDLNEAHGIYHGIPK